MEEALNKEVDKMSQPVLLAFTIAHSSVGTMNLGDN